MPNILDIAKTRNKANSMYTYCEVTKRDFDTILNREIFSNAHKAVYALRHVSAMLTTDSGNEPENTFSGPFRVIVRIDQPITESETVFYHELIDHLVMCKYCVLAMYEYGVTSSDTKLAISHWQYATEVTDVVVREYHNSTSSFNLRIDNKDNLIYDETKVYPYFSIPMLYGRDCKNMPWITAWNYRNYISFYKPSASNTALSGLYDMLDELKTVGKSENVSIGGSFDMRRIIDDIANSITEKGHEIVLSSMAHAQMDVLYMEMFGEIPDTEPAQYEEKLRSKMEQVILSIDTYPLFLRTKQSQRSNTLDKKCLAVIDDESANFLSEEMRCNLHTSLFLFAAASKNWPLKIDVGYNIFKTTMKQHGVDIYNIQDPFKTVAEVLGVNESDLAIYDA